MAAAGSGSAGNLHRGPSSEDIRRWFLQDFATTLADNSMSLRMGVECIARMEAALQHRQDLVLRRFCYKCWEPEARDIYAGFQANLPTAVHV